MKNVVLKEFSIKKGKNGGETILSSIRDSYVIINRKLIKGVMDAHPFVDFEIPKEVNNIPDNWVAVKKIHNSELSVYYVP